MGQRREDLGAAPREWRKGVVLLNRGSHHSFFPQPPYRRGAPSLRSKGGEWNTCVMTFTPTNRLRAKVRPPPFGSTRRMGHPCRANSKNVVRLLVLWKTIRLALIVRIKGFYLKFAFTVPRFVLPLLEYGWGGLGLSGCFELACACGVV